MDKNSVDDDDVPLPTTEQEVSENVYDWSDPERNDYDSDDSFLAPEEESDDGAGSDGDDDEVAILSPRTLAEMERRGRPRRRTRPPARYSPPVEGNEEERYTYDCVGADDDGHSEMETAPEEDDDSVYNPNNNGGGSSSEDDDDDDAEDEEQEEEEEPPSPRGVKRKAAEEEGESLEHVQDVADQRRRHDQDESPTTDG